MFTQVLLTVSMVFLQREQPGVHHSEKGGGAKYISNISKRKLPLHETFQP